MSGPLQPRPGLPASSHPDHVAWLAAEAERLLDFGEAARLPAGGFGWLDGNGRIDPGRQAVLMQCCRYTHCFALASLWGRPRAGELAEHGIASLTGAFFDEENGGWRSRFAPAGGTPEERPNSDSPGTGDAKTAYDHAFVVLATSSASVAGIDGARELLDEALSMVVERFCIDPHGLAVEAYSGSWEPLDRYRGANANMHLVEALLAAADATGASEWCQRAVEIAAVLIDEHARANDWRVPEHFDEAWRPLPDYNVDRPRDIFRPFGFTPGHGLEWSRLVLQLRAVASRWSEPPEWMAEAAEGLFRRALSEGWDDERGGIIYTVDRDGRPVVRKRLHWVLAEGISAAAARFHAALQPSNEEIDPQPAPVLGSAAAADAAGWYERLWDYVAANIIDRRGGWHHELDENNRPSRTMFDGKPDIYHAFQATLVPRLELSGGLAVPLRKHASAGDLTPPFALRLGTPVHASPSPARADGHRL